ncbi:MAG: YeiH family putative sulfate export transporter [Firmicutes bacterium]|nr:YeiH family putative sulfate export transporter [Bacillota bacterium]
MDFFRKKGPGLLLCFLIAVPAWLLGRAIPVIGGPVFGILFGMIIALARRPESMEAGIKFTSKKILQWSIILLGFEMNLFNVIKVGGQSLAVMVFTLSASFITAYFVGKAMKIDGKTTCLIGVGTSICGGSAIAATAPVIRANDEEVAQAISTIFLFNIIAVFIFPPLGHLIGLSDTGFGMWAGTAINDTSSVVAAGASWSSAAGNNTALAFATIVKLTRTLMIVPITLVLAVYTTRKTMSAEGNNYSIKKIFPWFVLGFVLTAIINTFIALPEGLPQTLVMIGKFMIVMAMTAIGLNTNLKKLLTNGLKPICLGLCCWFVVAVVSLIVQKMIGMI